MSLLPTRFDRPSLADPVIGSSTEVIGGPLGRHARSGTRGWTYAAAVLSSLGSVLVALGVLQKNHCVSNGWSLPSSLWRACYSDLPVAVNSSASQPWASGGPGTNQPVLTALLTWLVRQPVPPGSGISQQRTYFAIAAVVVALCIAACVVAIAWAMPRSPWVAAHMALSPVLITASLVSFDIFGVALTTVGMALWLRRQPAVAGVALGCAVMARSYPLVIAAAIVLVAVRDKRIRDLTLFVAALLGSSAVLIGAAAALGDPFAPYRAWWKSAVSYGSPWLTFQTLHLTVSPTDGALLAMIGWGVALATGIYLTARPARLTPLAPLALTMLVIVLLTGKTFTPQAALWVLPLIALCGFHWREHLIWAGVEIVYFVMLWMYVGSSSNPGKALTAEGFAVFSFIRLATYAALAWVSWETADELQDFTEPMRTGSTAVRPGDD